MDMNHDAHNYKKRLEATLERIKVDPRISQKNKDAIFFFQENCYLEKISTGRILRYLFDLRHLAIWLGKDFEAATKEDIKGLIGRIERQTFKKRGIDVPYQESTKRDLRITIRKLYKWIRDSEEYPDEVKWIKSTGRKCERVRLPEDMLSEDDIEKLLNHSGNSRDRAFIAVLYESGCRIGEMLFLRIKHVRTDQYGAQLLVDGKTGYRRIRIISSAPYLMDWINRHPLKGDPEAPVWISKYNHILSYVALRNVLRKIARKAGVKKKMNFHNFRHSRATYLANHLTEAQMKEFFGWVQASEMASIYVHLSGRDVDNALLKVYGLQKEEESKESQMNPKKCQRCQEVNPFTNVACNRCGFPLDDMLRNGIVQQDSERKKADHVIDLMLQDPNFKLLFMQKLREMQAPTMRRDPFYG